MLGENRECPDCGGEMYPIKLLDATDTGPDGGGIAHVEMAYASVDAAPSFLTRTIPRSGLVRAHLCQVCGRILLYALNPTPPDHY